MRLTIAPLCILCVAAASALPVNAGTLGVLFGYSPTGSQELVLSIGGSTTTLTATGTGWWDSTGGHGEGATNYGLGDGNDPSGPNHNDFFVFDLSGVSGTITGAHLSVGNAANGYAAGVPGGVSTLSMYDVSTPIATLEAGGSGLIGIFTDLGSGTLYASRTVSGLDDGTQVLISLDPAAITALNATEGGQFAIGGTLSAASPIPEPSTALLLATALAGLALAARSRLSGRRSERRN